MSIPIFFLLFQTNGFMQDSAYVSAEPVDFISWVDKTPVRDQFAGTRVINLHSVDMIPARSLEFIVAHKFGDIAGAAGGVPGWFGFDNLADVRIAFEYGLTKNINLGLGRSKGTGLLTQVADGYFKYKLLQQNKGNMPVTLVLMSSLSVPYGAASDDSTSITSYPDFFHRFIYNSQILVARKFSDRISVQMNFGYNHRNYVDYRDQNGLTYLGLCGRFRITKTIGLLAEYTYILHRPGEVNYTNHLGFGIEFITGGHVFSLNFTNSRAVTENLFIPATTEDWLKGQFRFGFSVNRRFKL
ncbi:MAG: hypothetical protein IPM74_12750 [Crocinitomicaceae bacterium]|nr:hypothetical protein [Crocinitomicaceae bacterium]MBK8926744.1 hypothetical protein [Crocinitomicaceae bacterium]